jgi:hypothetical protein
VVDLVVEEDPFLQDKMVLHLAVKVARHPVMEELERAIQEEQVQVEIRVVTAPVDC